MKNKPFLMISALALFMFALTGCWDSLDLEQRTSVVAIGIDLTEDKKQYVITVQIPIPQKIMGGAGAEKGEEAIKVMSAIGKTLNEALSNLQNRLNQQLFYGQARLIIFSETAARAGIEETLDYFRRSPQMRRLLWPLVVRGKASELLQANPRLEQLPSIFVMDLLETGVERGIIPDVSLGQLFTDLSTATAQATINYVSATKDEVKWDGLAVFRGDKMVGTLQDDEVWALLQIRDEKIAEGIDVPCMMDKTGGKKLVSFRPKSIKVKNAFSITGEESFSAKYHVRLEGDIIESQCDLDFTKLEVLEKLQGELSKEAKRRAGQMVAKLQKELHSDVLHLGLHARSQSTAWWSKEKWERAFPKGDIRVNYDVLIRRTGMETK